MSLLEPSANSIRGILRTLIAALRGMIAQCLLRYADIIPAAFRQELAPGNRKLIYGFLNYAWPAKPVLMTSLVVFYPGQIYSGSLQLQSIAAPAKLLSKNHSPAQIPALTAYGTPLFQPDGFGVKQNFAVESAEAIRVALTGEKLFERFSDRLVLQKQRRSSTSIL